MPHKPRQMQAMTVLQEQRLGRTTCSRGARCANAHKQAWCGAVHESAIFPSRSMH